MPALTLSRVAPETQGVSSSAILAFVEEANRTIREMHSFMLLRRGEVLAEGWWAPYRPDLPHLLFSLTKSFTSTGIGLCAAEGRLSVEDLVLSFFPEEAPQQPDPNLAKMRVRHLLSMSTGHAEDATAPMASNPEGNWVRGFLELPVQNEPGAPFVYNSAASHMLSAIVQKLTGQTLREYLQPRLFEPLGIQPASWDSDPRGINMGGWGLSLKTEDIARFGLLYQQKGVWNEQRILPESWVAEATRKQVNNGDDPNSEWAQGYGYQFWRCRHNAYRGDGAFGQYCLVLPDQEAVIAITSGVADMQKTLNLVWKHLLPAFDERPLPPDPAACAALERKLASLALNPPRGKKTSPLSASVSGKQYAFDSNDLQIERLFIEFKAQSCRLSVWAEGQEIALDCGYGAWRDNLSIFSVPLPAPAGLFPLPKHMQVSGVWTKPNVFKFTLRHVETPFYNTLTCTFDGDTIRVKAGVNVAFGASKFAPILGKASG